MKELIMLTRKYIPDDTEEDDVAAPSPLERNGQTAEERGVGASDAEEGAVERVAAASPMESDDIAKEGDASANEAANEADASKGDSE